VEVSSVGDFGKTVPLMAGHEYCACHGSRRCLSVEILGLSTWSNSVRFMDILYKNDRWSVFRKFFERPEFILFSCKFKGLPILPKIAYGWYGYC
jgi:hypothetical protein